MLYRPDVCNCTMPYVPRTVPAYAVRDPAYTAEVFALTLVQIDVMVCMCIFHSIDLERRKQGLEIICFIIIKFVSKSLSYNLSNRIIKLCCFS